MTQPIKLSKEELKEKALATQAANDKIHKLVVKIISWNNGLPDSIAVKTNNKISNEEWSKYKTHLLNISKIDSVEKVKNKIQDIYSSIKSKGGFE